MQVSVELQDNFSYAPVLGLAAAGLLIGIILIIWAFHKKKKKIVTRKPVVRKDRETYVRAMEELVRQYELGKLSERSAYQKLSKTIRQFVFDMTGIRVQYYTLQEIKEINKPQLTALIEECYFPEFSRCGGADFVMTVNKARKVIREWN